MDQHSFRFDWLVFLIKAFQIKAPHCGAFLLAGRGMARGLPVNVRLRVRRSPPAIPVRRCGSLDLGGRVRVERVCIGGACQGCGLAPDSIGKIVRIRGRRRARGSRQGTEPSARDADGDASAGNNLPVSAPVWGCKSGVKSLPHRHSGWVRENGMKHANKPLS